MQRSAAANTQTSGAQHHGKYADVKGGKRPDLPFRPRSTWEANVARLLMQVWYPQPFTIRQWFYEHQPYYFPAESRRGNYRIWPDFYLLSASLRRRHVDFAFLEVKGLLRRGGRLTTIDLNQLRGVDDDSRIRLERWKRLYPKLADRTWLIGQREYRWLERRYGHHVNGWEWPRTGKVTTLPSPLASPAALGIEESIA